MEFWEIYSLVGLFVLIVVTILWIISLFLHDSSVIDPFWGGGFVLITWIYFFLTPAGNPVRKWLITLLVTIWGLRLTLYLLWRNWGQGEDFRYQDLRRKSGDRWWWQSYFKVFLFQGAIMWFLSAPLLAGQIGFGTGRLILLDYLAVIVWLIGFYFETIGDWQLARFKANPLNKGKVLNSGVWRYSRHPNYFGDATQWWSFYLLAVAGGGFATVVSPLLMTFLLLRISGVPLLEKTLRERKPAYKKYMEQTSAFIPWFPLDWQGIK